ncbi:response regulator transcription factor [Streptomyces sp. NPDC093109]|uniref:response regulator transcription factor n=1 Tax=Streptomyces sp. NPDC093109 TaxID=3154977 RepID=UPI00344FA8C4
MIKVFVVEDHTVVRAGLAAVLDRAMGIEVVGGAGTGATALAEIARLRPDVVLLDIDLPDMDGINVAARLAEHSPASRALILTALDLPGHLWRALEAGVHGYLLKTVSPQALADAVRRVAAGSRVIDPGVQAAAEPAASPLTERETEVLALTASGADTRAIAAELFLSVGTVRNRLSSAVGKLNARTVVDAIRIGERNGWI